MNNEVCLNEAFAEDDDSIDDVLNQEYDRGYEQGKADAIEEVIHSLDNSKAICHEDYVDGIDFAIGVLRNIAEQMQKEVENESNNSIY